MLVYVFTDVSAYMFIGYMYACTRQFEGYRKHAGTIIIAVFEVIFSPVRYLLKLYRAFITGTGSCQGCPCRGGHSDFKCSRVLDRLYKGFTRRAIYAHILIPIPYPCTSIVVYILMNMYLFFPFKGTDGQWVLFNL